MTIHYFEQAQCGEPTDFAEPLDDDPPTIRDRLARMLADLRARHAADPAHHADPARIAAAVRVLEEGQVVPLDPLTYAVRDATGRRAVVSVIARGCTCGGARPCAHVTAIDLLQYLELTEREG